MVRGKRRPEKAIAQRLDFVFETTLGGNTIPQLLERVLDAGWRFASGTPD